MAALAKGPYRRDRGGRLLGLLVAVEQAGEKVRLLDRNALVMGASGAAAVLLLQHDRVLELLARQDD